MRSARLLASALVSLSVAAFVLPSQAASAVISAYSVLHEFSGADGHNPNDALAQGSDGNFYGTTSGNADGIDHGAVYRMDPAGNVTVLHTFNGADGDQPNGLIQGADGNFYGTTARGGTGPNCSFIGGCGTFFEMDQAGHVTVLHSFNNGTDDGNWPNGGIVQVADGSFYGTTQQGGGFGIAYRIGPSGAFTLLHRFTVADGINPQGGLILASDGNFYGVTNQYGPSPGGTGTAFRLDAVGNVTVIHGFTFGDGNQPKARLLQASDGFLYGTAESGGPYGAGVVFRVATDGSAFAVVHAFDAFGSDGFRPTTGLVQGSDGTIYGTAPLDGLPVSDPSRSGVVYRIDPAGTVSVLHTFHGPDGAGPQAGLLFAGGLLYGTAFAGGAAGKGVVFRENPGAPLPVALLAFNPDTVTAGGSSTGAITLATPAPSGGVVVDLSSNNTGAAQVPATVTVPGGGTGGTFKVTTLSSISSTARLRIFASVAGAGISGPFTVESAPAPPTLTSLTLSPSTVRGGAGSMGTETLSGPAGPSGVVVALSSSRPRIARVPSTVTIGAGASSATFAITTRQVSASMTVTITATYNGAAVSAQLAILP